MRPEPTAAAPTTFQTRCAYVIVWRRRWWRGWRRVRRGRTHPDILWAPPMQPPMTEDVNEKKKRHAHDTRRHPPPVDPTAAHAQQSLASRAYMAPALYPLSLSTAHSSSLRDEDAERFKRLN